MEGQGANQNKLLGNMIRPSFDMRSTLEGMVDEIEDQNQQEEIKQMKDNLNKNELTTPPVRQVVDQYKTPSPPEGSKPNHGRSTLDQLVTPKDKMISSFYGQTNQTQLYQDQQNAEFLTEDEIEKAKTEKPDSKKDDSLIQDDNSSQNKAAGLKNIFGKSQKSFRKSIEKDSQIIFQDSRSSKKMKAEMSEIAFELNCQEMLKNGAWEKLEMAAIDQLDLAKAKSPKGYFFLGVALFKMKYYQQAIEAFKRSDELLQKEQAGQKIKKKDPQLEYNMGLAYFKNQQYPLAVEHLKMCIQLEPTHSHAYNNLAFIYNMHNYFDYTIDVCTQAEKAFIEEAYKKKMEYKKRQGSAVTTLSQESPINTQLLDHHCHRHWAFALFKRCEMSKAIKQIKKAVDINDKEPENWLVWGLIMRKVGQYQSAKNKFEQSLKLDPKNQTAIKELELLSRIIEMDSQITLEQVAHLKKMRPNYDLPEGYDYRSGNLVQDHKNLRQYQMQNQNQQSDDWLINQDGYKNTEQEKDGKKSDNSCLTYDMSVCSIF